MKYKVTNQLNELLQLCLKQDRKAQQALFEVFGPVMKVVCRRYLYDSSEIDEVLNQGFLKVFTHLSSYRAEGNFEGWIRRIIIRECIDTNRKRKVSYSINEYEESRFLKQTAEADANNDVAHLLDVINALPMGYKTVFNLIEIEGYKHKEVAQKLGITEAASRSQLTRAKKLLRNKLHNLNGL